MNDNLKEYRKLGNNINDIHRPNVKFLNLIQTRIIDF